MGKRAKPTTVIDRDQQGDIDQALRDDLRMSIERLASYNADADPEEVYFAVTAAVEAVRQEHHDAVRRTETASGR